MAAIKNIIFDLGGVLVDLDFKKTFAAFKELGVENIEQMYSQHHASELFKKLETGLIGEKEFLAAIRKYVPGIVSDEQIKHAWNAMILGFRPDSLTELERIAKKYRIFLLSNTNSIHLRRVHQVFAEEIGKPSLDQYFSRSWYSNLIGLRKPDKEIYQFVLEDADLDPSETFFIDDTIENIETAIKLGIRSHLLLAGEKIEDLQF